MQQVGKTIVVAIMAVMMISLITASPSRAMMGGGGSSSGGPMRGGNSSGGMMGSMGDMMGDIFGGNSNRGPQNNGQYTDKPEVVSSQMQAETMVRENIARNPNVKTGAVIERENDFTVDILTKDGAVIDQMIVDKKSGNISSIYR